MWQLWLCFSTGRKVLSLRSCAQPPRGLAGHPITRQVPCAPSRPSLPPRLLRGPLSRSSHAVSNKVNDPKYAPVTPLLGFQPTETNLHATKSFAQEHPRWLCSRQPDVEQPGSLSAADRAVPEVPPLGGVHLGYKRERDAADPHKTRRTSKTSRRGKEAKRKSLRAVGCHVREIRLKPKVKIRC